MVGGAPKAPHVSARTLARWALVVFASGGCVGDHEIPKPSDDPSVPGPVGAVGATSTVQSSSSTTSASGSGGGGTGGGAAAGTGGAGGAIFTPDCTCLHTRALDTGGCTNCCRSCYDTTEVGACQAEIDACNADQDCIVALELAKSCPADQNFESCVALSFDFASSVTRTLAQQVLDCACDICVMCGTGDTCP